MAVSTQFKPLVYQLFVRQFGNKNPTAKQFGTLAENGCGTFNDINDAVVHSLKDLNVSHVWLTGVLEHASLTAYPKSKIAADHPEVVKGIAGSPYAIRDYYDICPDLASSPSKRLPDFKACLKRLQNAGLKVIIDFVPNHVARQYISDALPKGYQSLGAEDDNTKAFDLQNNFYYLPGTEFVAPTGHNAHQYGIKFESSYQEVPAKATGDDRFEPQPSADSWFETIKLNYGYLPGTKTFVGDLNSPPDTWHKMYDILSYWVGLGVDGFRCDMVELVPDQFWTWVINKLKTNKADLVWIGEVYEPNKYELYLRQCGFDWLYDKVGMYDLNLALAKGEPRANDWDSALDQTKAFHGSLLRFVENHDEVRIAGKFGATSAQASLPALLLAGAASAGPIMIYNGQEVGEPAEGASGYSGDDGKTSIFDYGCMPAVQRWYNDGLADGGHSTVAERVLRQDYVQLLRTLTTQPLLENGLYYGLQYANKGNSWDYDDRHILSFLRHDKEGKAVLVVVSMMDRTMTPHVKIPWEAWDAIGLHPERNFLLRDLLSTEYINFSGFDVLDLRNTQAGVPIPMQPWQGRIFEIVAV